MPQSSQRHFELHRLEDVAKVQGSIMDMIEPFDYDRQAVFAIRLALDEALSNAVRHGNKCDPNKTAYVDCSVHKDVFDITVRDQGPGFNPDKLPDPTDEENLCCPNGRGVMLMRAYMTTVEFTDNGRQVHMTKRATDTGGPS